MLYDGHGAHGGYGGHGRHGAGRSIRRVTSPITELTTPITPVTAPVTAVTAQMTAVTVPVTASRRRTRRIRHRAPARRADVGTPERRRLLVLHSRSRASEAAMRQALRVVGGAGRCRQPLRRQTPGGVPFTIPYKA